jgi:hypothetical protein
MQARVMLRHKRCPEGSQAGCIMQLLPAGPSIYSYWLNYRQVTQEPSHPRVVEARC